MIPLFRPYVPELPRLNALMHSGQLAYGTETKAFESSLCAYFEHPYVLAVNSFSSAVSIVLQCLGIHFGDEVIASPMGCLVSTQPYLAYGCQLRWCDVCPDTGTLDPEKLKERITPRTKAIIHNHFCGYPGFMDEVQEIARSRGIPIIDDGIECFGTLYHGEKIGTCSSDVAIFSFSAVRLPNTIDGAAIVFQSKEHYEKALRLRDSGIDRAHFRDELGEINPLCDISEVGYSATMSNVNGYMGTEQMKQVEQLIARQRANAAAFEILLDGTQWKPLNSTHGTPNYWVYGVLSDHKREDMQLWRRMGWYASGVHINNAGYSVFPSDPTLTGTMEFQSRFFALPCGWWVTPEQIKDVKIYEAQ